MFAGGNLKKQNTLKIYFTSSNHSSIQHLFIEAPAMYTAILLQKYSLNDSFLTWRLTKAKDVTFNSTHQNTFYQKTNVLAKNVVFWSFNLALATAFRNHSVLME